MRRGDWMERLWHVLADAQRKPFEFGRHDCAHLVAVALDAMTDSNWQAYIANLYRDRMRARRISTSLPLLEATVTEVLGEPVPINLARRGDVVSLDLETGPAIGICVGERIAAAGDGVQYLPLHRAHMAWRIE